MPQPETCGDGVDQDCNGADLPCPAADGDDCATAIDISQGGTFPGTLVGLADDHVSCRGGINNGADAVYTFTLSVPSLVYLDTLGAAFDTVLTVESGACNGGAQVVCADDACTSLQSQVVTQVLGAGTYYVWVNSYNATVGAFDLTYHSSPCTDAVALSTDPWTISGSTPVDTTGAPASYGGTCGAGSSGPERWFYFTTCGGTHTFTADTCGTAVDTVLYLRSGSCEGAELSCNDDGCGYPASQLTTQVGQGWHWLAVDGFGGNAGASTLTWSYTTP